MADRIPTIYRFANATLIRWNGRGSSDVVLFDDGELLSEDSKTLTRETRDKLGRSSYRFHGKSTGELKLIESKWSQELTRYIPRNGSSELRDLSEDDYGKLSPGFQKLYEKLLAEPEENRMEVSFELKNLEGVALSEAVVLGREQLTELHGIILPIRDRARRSNSWNSSFQEDRAELARNLPLELSAEELIRIVDNFGAKIRQGTGYRAQVTTDSAYRGPSELRIDFFGEPYEGAMRKVLSTKRDGKPYADRRGRMVKDLPTSVGSAVVKLQELNGWWDSIGGELLSDEEKLETLTELTRHLWRL